MLTNSVVYCGYVDAFACTGTDDWNVDGINQRADPAAVIDDCETAADARINTEDDGHGT